MNYEIFDNINYFHHMNDNNKNMHHEYNDHIKVGNNDMYHKYNDHINESKSLNLYNPYEAYVKGNLYRNLYEGYKNHQPAKIKINNEREEMLVEIGQFAFAAHEMNLYLDNFPNDKRALDEFNLYRSEADALIKNYERKYGPLSIASDSMNEVPFSWEHDMWPWEC